MWKHVTNKLIEAKFFRITTNQKRRKTSKVTSYQFIFLFQPLAKFIKNSKAQFLIWWEKGHQLSWKVNHYFRENEIDKLVALWFDRKRIQMTLLRKFGVVPWILRPYFDDIFQESDISFVRSQPQLFPASDSPEKASTSKVRADASSQIFEQFSGQPLQ